MLCRTQHAASLTGILSHLAKVDAQVSSLQERQQQSLAAQQRSLAALHDDFKRRMGLWEVHANRAAEDARSIDVRPSQAGVCVSLRAMRASDTEGAAGVVQASVESVALTLHGAASRRSATEQEQHALEQRLLAAEQDAQQAAAVAAEAERTVLATKEQHACAMEEQRLQYAAPFAPKLTVGTVFSHHAYTLWLVSRSAVSVNAFSAIAPDTSCHCLSCSCGTGTSHRCSRRAPGCSSAW